MQRTQTEAFQNMNNLSQHSDSASRQQLLRAKRNFTPFYAEVSEEVWNLHNAGF